MNFGAPDVERSDDAWDVISTKDFDAVVTVKAPSDIHVYGDDRVDPDKLADLLEKIAEDLRELKRNRTL